MTIRASEVIDRLCGQIGAIVKAAELASDRSVPMSGVYGAIEKCMASDCGVAKMGPVYESILAAAMSTRQIFDGVKKKREDVASVYFIRREDGLVKIGYSCDPTKRLSQLKQQHQCGMTMLATIKGARRREKELHTRFAAHRAQGEWFFASKDLMEFIANSTASPMIC
jgi:hypothetical protein